MVHLLRRLYGVDAPGDDRSSNRTGNPLLISQLLQGSPTCDSSLLGNNNEPLSSLQQFTVLASAMINAICAKRTALVLYITTSLQC